VKCIYSICITVRKPVGMQQLQLMWHTVHQEGSNRTLLFQFSGRFHDKAHSSTIYLKALSSYNVSFSICNRRFVFRRSLFFSIPVSCHDKCSKSFRSALEWSGESKLSLTRQSFPAHFFLLNSQYSSTNTFKGELPYWPRNFVEITAFHFLIPGWNWVESYKEIQRISGVPYVVC
jgi:hypothetical protein